MTTRNFRPTLQRWKRYWTAVGVIPRWQLVLAYSLITFAFLYGTKTNSDQSAQIQAQRAEATRNACESQNKRNAEAFVYLQGLSAQDEDNDDDGRTPAEQAKLLQDFTDAVAGPVRDCDAVVKAAVADPPDS